MTDNIDSCEILAKDCVDRSSRLFEVSLIKYSSDIDQIFQVWNWPIFGESSIMDFTPKWMRPIKGKHTLPQ